VTRLIIVAVAAIGLILFVAFVVARLVESRTRGLSIRMQVFLALAVIVGAFSFGLGLMVIDRIEARAVERLEGRALGVEARERALASRPVEARARRLRAPANRLAVHVGGVEPGLAAEELARGDGRVHELRALGEDASGAERVVPDLAVAHVVVARQPDRLAVGAELGAYAGRPQPVQGRGRRDRDRVGLVAVAVLVPSTAWSQKKPAADKKEEEVFDFEGDTVSTDFLKPNTMLVEGLRRGRSRGARRGRSSFAKP